MTSDPNPSIRPRNQAIVPIHPSHISLEELQLIQNTLPTWLTEIEGQCAQIREETRRVKNELKQVCLSVLASMTSDANLSGSLSDTLHFTCCL